VTITETSIERSRPLTRVDLGKSDPLIGGRISNDAHEPESPSKFKFMGGEQGNRGAEEGPDSAKQHEHFVRIPTASNFMSDVVPVSHVMPNASEAKKPDRLKRFLKKK
jgi:hypothetical protein